MEKKYNLFTYGTLMSGFTNNRLLAGAKKIGNAVYSGKLTMYDNGGYPRLKNDKSTNRKIYGEVYEITGEHLMRIDLLELPYGYKKQVVPVNVGGKVIHAFVYVNTSIGNLLMQVLGKWKVRPSGNFKIYRKGDFARKVKVI